MASILVLMLSAVTACYFCKNVNMKKGQTAELEAETQQVDAAAYGSQTKLAEPESEEKSLEA